jgi:hypothetical protein
LSLKLFLSNCKEDQYENVKSKVNSTSHLSDREILFVVVFDSIDAENSSEKAEEASKIICMAYPIVNVVINI